MRLLEPCRIGTMELNNRLVMAPMSVNLTENGFVTEQMIRFFEERARGRVGLITIGDGIVDSPLGNNVKESTAIHEDRCIPPLKKLTDAVKSHGSKIALQISHGGRRAGRVSKDGYLEVTKGQIPVAPSPLAHPVPGQVVPRELSREEIGEIVESFGEATRRAIEAGFDAIGLHCAHMYLCGEFLSPWANRRSDEYGRDFEGRMKFVLEIVERIKKETEGKYPLIARMNGQEPEGGNSLEDIQRIARRLEQSGVDAIHVSVGFGAATKDPGFIPSVTPMRAPAGCIMHLVDNIKNAVSVPVIAVNKLGNPHFAEQVLQEGRADLISLGRPLIADPYLPAKVAGGKFDDVRPCINCCQGCLQNVLEHDAPVACSVNPNAGREMEDPVKEASRKKRVLVLGGGPAGLQAALTVAERGHTVCLMEKSNELGGELIVASKPPGKADIAPFLGYLTSQINKKGIQTELGKELTQEWLDEYDPDVAVIATGSVAVMPSIEGLHRQRAYMPSEILMGEEINGKRVLVIGGGTVGCEVAEFLCEKGKEVIIVEILDDIARDMDRINRLPLLLSLEAHGVRILTKTKVASIEDQGAWVVCLGNKEFIEADAIVMAAGKETRLEAVDELIKRKVSEFYLVGDKARPGGILEAVRDGYDVANRI